MLQDCIKKDELFFSRTQYINDYLIDFYFKNSRFILNNEKPLEIKPIVSVLKIIPNYIKKFFTNAELVYPEKDKNDIEFLASPQDFYAELLVKDCLPPLLPLPPLPSLLHFLPLSPPVPS